MESLSEHETFTVEKFHEFIKKNPNFFFPAIFLQNILQTEMIGMSYWDKAKKVRHDLSGGKDYFRWTKLVHHVEVRYHNQNNFLLFPINHYLLNRHLLIF